ncbi:receptor activity-modifying protein 1 isoform X1 [Coturnix japonica]|uniref:Receptor activity-modifying protein 1 n=2 Tax=Coturnix japonica TaxID=93934 RepID=A0A8C2TR33_COTJA|nr:receptor activity-modifying protein 1 isoform X1 [Coturnix japonica]
MALLPRRFLCFVLAHHFIAATACHEAEYGRQIRERCLRPFKLSMEGIGQRLWCDWDETMGTYGELTNCTVAVAENLTCYWPNRLVDEFFVAVHSHYFKNCSPSGRALRDPPNGILCPFILVPILVTLLMTALVVWRSKRSEASFRDGFSGESLAKEHPRGAEPHWCCCILAGPSRVVASN